MPAGAQRPINDGTRVDSLEALLRTSAIDTVRIDAMQSLSGYWLYKDSARAMDYAQQSKEASLKIKNSFRTALSHFYIGNVYSWLLCVYTEHGRTGSVDTNRIRPIK